MTKNLLYFLIVTLLLSACVSSKKLMNQGHYDQAIAKAVKKLKKKPTKTKQIMVLKNSYRMANQFDNERIDFLKKSGQPEIWDEVFRIFDNMKRRQNTVKTLNSSVLSKINFIPINYDNEIISAKKKAAEYYYAHGKRLLERGDKLGARQAYDEFVRVKDFYPNYKDIDILIPRAYEMGINHVLFMIRNSTRTVLPEDFEYELLKVSMKDVNSKWVDYDTRPDEGIEYDYNVILDLKNIQVTPEQVSRREYKESKEIEDGWKYLLDANGNVKKDTAGNDIKIPKYVEVAMYVTEIHLVKKAMVNATLDYYDNRTNQLVKSDPITSEWIFDHTFAEIKGDKRAMSAKTRKLSKIRPLPFPSDLEMIFRTNEHIKKMTKDILYRNRRLMEQA